MAFKNIALFLYMKNYRQKLGISGEKMAAEYLKKKGYQIIERNFRVREGEIDIISRRKNELIFIEVKTRTSLTYGFPEEAVGEKKQQKILAVINRYLENKGLNPTKWHLEIITLFFDRKKRQFSLRHLKNL